MRFRPWQGMLACLMMILALLAGCGKPAGEAVQFETLEQGAYSGITEKKTVLITDQESWGALWQSHAPEGASPAVPFQEESVLAVFLGERSSGGHAVNIADIRIDGSKVIVTVQESKPGDSMTTGALTQPFHMVKLAKVPAGAELTVNWK